MIQNIDSFPLEPVLMLKFAIDFGFFSILPTASQLATSLDCVPQDGVDENSQYFSRYSETTLKHSPFIRSATATFTLMNLLNKIKTLFNKWTLEHTLHLNMVIYNKDPKNLERQHS